MTQFFRDFQSDTEGVLPAGFAEQGSDGNFEVKDWADGNGKVLAFRFTIGLSDRFIWWTGAAGPGSILNGDILVKVYQRASAFNDTGLDAGFALCRIPNPPSSISSNQMVGTAVPNPTTLRINRTRGYNSYATSSIAFTHSTNYYVRFNFNGTAYKAKFWESGDTEPAAWDIETTASSDQDPGYVGAQVYKGYEMNWHWFSVSDNPAVAADNPDVASGPETPVSLSVTDILATSARLNWEQG